MTAAGFPLEFRRTRTEKTVAVIALFLTAQTGYFCYRTTIASPRFELTCDRATGQCALDGADIFGGRFTSRVAIADLRKSEARPKNGEVAWVITQADGKPWQIGNPSGRSTQKQQYQTLAPELQHFLDHPAQTTYHASFEGLGGPSGALFIAIVLALLALALAIIQGWRATITLDDAGELTVRRSFRATTRFALSRVAETRLRPRALFILFAVVPLLNFEILDAEGAVLFKRRTTSTPRTRAQFEAAAAVLAARNARTQTG